ncbi:HAD family hydrolase [Ideonella sp.]|uniref:HAD family hydrolase n=1 Tax=Ideonella sp. TaxID=1929293 RepID=UPI003BB7FF36
MFATDPTQAVKFSMAPRAIHDLVPMIGQKNRVCGHQSRPSQGNAPLCALQIPADTLVFDMDGVLLQSNRLKHDAMLALFEMDAAQRLAVERYNLGAGGVPRQQKFAHIWVAILGRAYGAEVEAALASAYALAIARRLLDVPLVEGVQDFVESCGMPCYVCTAAPDAEAHELLTRRGLAGLFAGIHGSSTSKHMALEAIARQAKLPTDRLLFFGDSHADWQAARAAGCRFVGVTREKNDFVGEAVPTIRDFDDKERLQDALKAAHPTAPV